MDLHNHLVSYTANRLKSSLVVDLDRLESQIIHQLRGVEISVLNFSLKFQF